MGTISPVERVTASLPGGWTYTEQKVGLLSGNILCSRQLETSQVSHFESKLKHSSMEYLFCTTDCLGVGGGGS